MPSIVLTPALTGVLLTLMFASGTARAVDPSVAAGESIYLRGVLSSGSALVGKRSQIGIDTSGADGACVNCHQRSGFGTYEGYNNAITIPPIAGQYLFHSREAVPKEKEPILPYVEWMHGNRDPYTDATLARAIREGLDSQGRPLKDLMPRYAMGDGDMASLIAYLKSLDQRPEPGVSGTELQFATVVAPDAGTDRRDAMLQVMRQYFDDKNKFPIGASAQLRTSGKTEYAKSMFHANRLWRLHVWELKGPASVWGEQLDQDFAREPVMALVSGLGGANWAPVHDFCERHGVPCLFPNVDVPVVDSDFYPLYFSRGVLLEAELIAKALNTTGSPHPTSIRQVFRAGDSGEAAAANLARAVKQRGISPQDVVLPAQGPKSDVAAAVRATKPSEVLVLWLRGADLAALPADAGGTPTVFISGLMAGLENAPLPPAWRARAKMTYPYDLPERRSLRLRYPESWFSIRHIAMVDEPMQVNTYMACGLLAETLSHMADNLVQPFLIEMLQTSIERRLINTGYFPHMVLGWNQHFASKGGYIVHFVQTDGTQVAADTDWVVP